MDKELVIVIDFGGQYNQLVARRVRECNVYCEIYSYKTDLAKIIEKKPRGIILTGGPSSCYEEGAATCPGAGALLWGTVDDAGAGGRGGPGRSAGVRQDRGRGRSLVQAVYKCDASYRLLDEPF